MTDEQIEALDKLRRKRRNLTEESKKLNEVPVTYRIQTLQYRIGDSAYFSINNSGIEFVSPGTSRAVLELFRSDVKKALEEVEIRISNIVSDGV